VHFALPPNQRLPLRPRQIHYLQLTKYSIMRIIRQNLLHIHAENSMRARRVHVHPVTADYLVFDPVVEEGDDVVVGRDFDID